MNMINFVLMPENAEVAALSKTLGYEQTYFLGKDFVLVKDKKEIRGKLRVCKPNSEAMLRLILEKSPVEIVYGIESIHEKDSLHYVRGGLDQVLCKIAAQKGKTIAFSFSELLNATNKSRVLSRMRFNMELCRKYKVKTLISNFATEKMDLRAAKDLEAFGRVLGKG